MGVIGAVASAMADTSLVPGGAIPKVRVGPADTVMVLGDSISAGYGIPVGSGWVELLEQKLVRQGIQWQVVNASISGETTKGALNRLPNLLKRHQPKIVVIELGGNDGLSGFPLTRIRANFEAMIQMIQQAGAKIILLGMRLPPNYGGRYADPFFQQYTLISEQYQTALVPFFLDGIATRSGFMQSDGIHPSEFAQPLLLDHVWKPLQPMLNTSVQQP